MPNRIIKKILFCLFFMLTSFFSDAACVSPNASAGSIDYNSTTKNSTYCNGSEWKNLKYGGVDFLSDIGDAKNFKASSINSLDMSGNYAYVTHGTSMYVIDVTDVSNPTYIASFNHPNNTQIVGVKIDGTTAYLISSNWVLALDVTIPSNPTLIGSIYNSAMTSPRLIEFHNGYVYGLKDGAIFVFDFLIPSAPVFVASLVDAVNIRQPFSTYVSGNFLYISDQNYDQLTILDITNPSTISVESMISDSVKLNGISDLYVQGNYLYGVAKLASSLVIVDVTDKANPSIFKEFKSSGINNGVRLVAYNQFLFVGCDTGSSSGSYLTTIDISNPLEPEEIFKIYIEGARFPGADYMKASSGRLALYSADSNFISTYDISSKPLGKQSIENSLFAKNNSSTSMIASVGNYAVAAGGAEEIFIYDVSTPSTPVPRGAWRTPDGVNLYGSALEFDGQYAYYGATNRATVYIVDVGTNPDRPKMVAQITDNLIGTVHNIIYQNNYIYVANKFGSRLTIVDVTNRANPIIVGSLQDSTNLSGIIGLFKEGNYVYVASGTAKTFSIIDVSDKANPTLVSSITDATLFSALVDVTKVGNYVYLLAQGNDSLFIIDVTNPSSPVYVSQFQNSTYYDYGYSLIAKGSTLVISSFLSGISFVDISNPLNPTPYFRETGSNTLFAINGNYVYNPGNWGIKTYDITTPATPTSLGIVNYVGQLQGASSFQKIGNYGLITSTTNKSIAIVNLTDVNDLFFEPSFIDTTNLNGSIDMVVDGSYAYVLGSNQFSIYDISTLPTISFVSKVTDISTISSASRLIVEGNYLYLSSSSASRITIYDISNKASPTLVSSLNDSNLSGAFDMKKIGNYIYTTSKTAKTFCSVDVSNVSSPVIGNCYSDATYFDGIQEFEIIGNIAFVTTYTTSTNPTLTRLDISNPLNITLIESIKTGRSMFSLIKKGNTIFFSHDNGTKYGQFFVDASGEVRAQSKDIAYYGNSTYQRLYVVGDYLYSVSSLGGTFSIVDISDKTAPSYLETFFKQSDSITSVNDTSYDHPYLYGINYTGYLHRIDVSDPLNASLVDEVSNVAYSQAGGLYVKNNIAFVTVPTSSSISSYDISNFQRPKLLKSIASFSNQNNIGKIKAVGNTLYAAAGSSSVIASFDISDPANFTSLHYLKDTTNFSWFSSFDISGNYLYFCTPSTDKLHIIDISNPSAMVRVDSIVDSVNFDNCSDLKADGNYLYLLSASTDSLTIIDISNPTVPTVVSRLVDPVKLDYLQRMVVNGNYILASTTLSSGYTLIDITNKNSPEVNTNFQNNYNNGAASIGLIGGKYFSYTNNPTTGRFLTFEVRPEINLSSCSVEGQIAWDPVNKAMGFCNGTHVKSMGPIPGAGGGGCSSPSGIAGAMEYNTSLNQFQYCDGANWISI